MTNSPAEAACCSLASVSATMLDVMCKCEHVLRSTDVAVTTPDHDLSQGKGHRHHVTSVHARVKAYVQANMNTQTPKHLDTETPEHLNTWTPKHTETPTQLSKS